MDPALMVQAAFGGIGGGVPTSVPQSSGANLDDARSWIQNIDPKLVSAATTPIPGAHTGQVPSSFMTPIGPAAQGNMIPTQGVVGKGYGKAVGIGNAIIGATNALSSVVTAEAQHKQNQVRDAATKVITAQQGIDEAKQQHDAALENLKNATPGSPEAQQYQDQVTKFQGVLDQNTKARDDVFADPKVRKSLAKGFDISYVDPSANNTEEHKAVQAAMKQAKTLAEKKQIMQQAQQKAGSAAGEAYAKAQPQGLTMDAGAQQKLAIAQGQQKIQQEAYKNYLTYKASAMHANATVTAAQLHEQGALMMKQAEFDQQQNLLNQRNTQAEKMLGERYNDQLKLMVTRAALARQTAKNIYNDREADPLNMYTKTRLAAETYKKNMDSNITLYQSLYMHSKTNSLCR